MAGWRVRGERSENSHEPDWLGTWKAALGTFTQKEEKSLSGAMDQLTSRQVLAGRCVEKGLWGRHRRQSGRQVRDAGALQVEVGFAHLLEVEPTEVGDRLEKEHETKSP